MVLAATQYLYTNSIGFITTNYIGGGFLTERYGSKWVFGLAVFGSSALGFVLPVMASWGSGALLAVRIVQGALQGPIIPNCLSICVTWMPTSERTRALGFVHAGFSHDLARGLSGPVFEELSLRWGCRPLFGLGLGRTRHLGIRLGGPLLRPRLGRHSLVPLLRLPDLQLSR